MKKEIDFQTHELEQLATSLSTIFIQRRDLYARQLDDGSYVCIHEPLRNKHLIAHLHGEITLGTYLLDLESQARFVVFDAVFHDKNWMCASVRGAHGYAASFRVNLKVVPSP